MNEPQRLDAPKYVVDPLSHLPQWWHDHISNLRVLTRQPHEGYVMVRRQRAPPFVLHVRELLNTKRHTMHGPFILGKKPKDTAAPIPRDQSR